MFYWYVFFSCNFCPFMLIKHWMHPQIKFTKVISVASCLQGWEKSTIQTCCSHTWLHFSYCHYLITFNLEILPVESHFEVDLRITYVSIYDKSNITLTDKLASLTGATQSSNQDRFVFWLVSRLKIKLTPQVLLLSYLCCMYDKFSCSICTCELCCIICFCFGVLC